jgi:hypothetical protein
MDTMKTTDMSETERRLDLLDSRLVMNLSLNDLRILVGSFRAIQYQMGLDDTSYLDADGLGLKHRLEDAYRGALVRLGMPVAGRTVYATGGIN